MDRRWDLRGRRYPAISGRSRYSLSSDWDDRWRTGGSVAEVIEEAHLDEDHILKALERFAADRSRRLRRLRERLDDA